MTLQNKETTQKYNQLLISVPRHNTIQNMFRVNHISPILGKYVSVSSKSDSCHSCSRSIMRDLVTNLTKMGNPQGNKNLKAVIIQGQKNLIVQRIGYTLESIADDLTELNFLIFKPSICLRANYEEE